MAPGHKKTWRYLAERLARGRWATQKKRLAFMVSVKRKEGVGGNRTAEKKKSRALASVTSNPGHRGYPCPLPCLWSCLCRCLCLSWPVPALSGRYTEKGSGAYWFSFLKRATEYKCMELGRGVYAADGKNRPGVMAWAIPGRETRGYDGVSGCLVGKTERWGQPHRAWTHDYPCLWTGQYPCLWTSLR